TRIRWTSNATQPDQKNCAPRGTLWADNGADGDPGDECRDGPGDLRIRSRWESGRSTGANVTKCHLMSLPEAKLGRKQEEAIAALLTQPKIDDAARNVGISARTLIRWMKLPEFQAAYREARRLTFRQSVARLQQASSAAATTLFKVM